MQCPTREAVYGKDGIKDQMKEIRDELQKIDKRLSRIEWLGIGVAAAYVFFSTILPVLIRMGTAAAAIK
jgi:hypothetical protein